jgi:hypothetical protein
MRKIMPLIADKSGFNFLTYLSETRFDLYGIKINFLVIGFIVWVVMHILFKLKAYSHLSQARISINKFATKLRELEPTEDLRAQVKDFFAQEMNGMSKAPLGAPPNMMVHLQHAWQEFSEGIQIYPLGSSRLVNTYQAEDFFTSHALVKPFTQPLSHIGGLYTSMGLLFTFIALGAGMSGLIYQAPGMPIEGLGPFINALSGKFVTSIIGLAIALLVEGKIRELEHEIEDDLADIIYHLNRSVRRLTNQSILSEMNASIKAIPENIETLLNKSYQDGGMMAQLKDTIESSLKGVIETHVKEIRSDLAGISNNLKGFGEDGAAQLTEVMKALGPELKEAISSGVSGDITQLNETLGRLPEVMEASLASVDKLQHNITESQAMMLSSVRELLGTLSTESKGSLEEVLRILNENTNNFQNRMLTYQEQQQQKNRESLQTLTDMLETLRQRQTEYTSQLDQNVSVALEKLETNHTQAQQKAGEAFAALEEVNVRLLEQMQQSMADAGQKAKQQLEEQQESTEQTLQLQRRTVEEQLDVLRSSLVETQKLTQEEMMNSVQQLFEQQNAILSPLLTELQNSFRQFEMMGETLPERIRDTEEAVRSSVTELERFLEERMRPFIQQAQELTQHQQQLNLENETQVNKLQALQSSMIGSQDSLGKMTTNLSSLHQDIVQNTIETNGTLTRNSELVADCIQKLNDTRTLLDQEYGRLNQLARDIASTYTDAGESMTQAIEQMHINASGFYGELGNETGKLTNELQSAISSLSGAVTQFEEVLEDVNLSRN